MENTQEKDARVRQPRSDSNSSLSGTAAERKEGLVGVDGITRLSEATDLSDTAYAFSTKRKWWILTVVALCQTSMSEFLLSPIQLRKIIFIASVTNTKIFQTSTQPCTQMPSPR